MQKGPSMIELVGRRYSCRSYRPQAIETSLQSALMDYLSSDCVGPLGSRGRFKLVAAAAGDTASLKGLGTYGFIKDAPGFIVGAVPTGPHAMEDYGYLLERVILHATELGLGTCWLGGTFSKSNFAKKIELKKDEVLPAVTPVGYPLDGSRERDKIRKQAGSNFRHPAALLFFDGGFGNPISPEAAGPYWDVLEAVRWAPSASNKQPWRLVRTQSGWHFYLERTKGYGKGSIMFRLLGLGDLQRVDIGIAMCHFELVAKEKGLAGSWVLEDPSIPSDKREYIVTWKPAKQA